MREIWKDIPGYKGFYQVSDCGNVRSVIKGKDGEYTILRGSTTVDGYRTVQLCVNQKKRVFRVHRLVLETFVGKSSKEVHHIDGNRQNNKLSNLIYLDRCQNMAMRRKTPVQKKKVLRDLMKGL